MIGIFKDIHSTMSDIIDEKPTEMGEEPLVRTSFSVNGRTQWEFSRALLVYSGAVTLIGIALLISYFILSAESRDALINMNLALLLTLLCMGSLLSLAGLAVTGVLIGNIVRAARNSGSYSCTFSEEEMIVCTENEKGETEETLRYSEFKKIKETKRRFLLYRTGTIVYPVEKGELSEDEIAALRRVFLVGKSTKINH